MKRTLYIESILHEAKDSAVKCEYVSINQNAKWIHKTLICHNILCQSIQQFSDSYWQVEIKGRRKNVRAFIADLILNTSDIYMVREYK